MARGRFITVEGGEGAGKSTQTRRLAEWLAGLGVGAIATREPGGSPGAEEIRRLLVTGEPERWSAMTEALLLFAARRDHLERTIRPALDAGVWVVCDRFVDSTVVYQGYGRGLDLAALDRLTALVVGDALPDLTLILDLPPDAGLARTKGRFPGGGAEDRFERMTLEFHQRLREGFLAVAARAPGRCVVIDAAQPLETVAHRLQSAVAARFGLSGL